MDCTIYVGKTKALISFAVKLICVFVFACVKCWFSNDAAQIILSSFHKSIGQYQYSSLSKATLQSTQNLRFHRELCKMRHVMRKLAFRICQHGRHNTAVFLRRLVCVLP